MKKFLQNSAAILALIIAIVFLPITAHANAPEFVDVPREHQYYDDIMLLADHGVISGYDDKTFKPESFISVAEAIIITERVFGNPNNLPEWSKWEELTKTGYVYETNWYIDFTSFFNKYDSFVNWDLGSQLVLNVNSAFVFNSEIVGAENNRHVYLNNILFRGYETDKEYYQPMTRAEFCGLVVWAMDSIHNIPDYKKDFPIKITYVGDEYDSNEHEIFEVSTLGSFLKAPDWLLKYYSRNNGMIKIVEEGKWDVKNHKESSAYIDYQPHKSVIYIRDAAPSVALHELGHFIWFKENLYMSKEIMDEEADALKKVSQSSYCKTDIREYFAEAFQCYYLNNKKLEEEAPKTFEFVNELVTKLETKIK